MKLVTRILSLLILAGFAAFYTSCNKDDGNNKSEEEKQFDKLKASWSLVTANDGTDRTPDFQNLVLTLSGTFAKGGTFTYSFTGTRPTPSPWPGSGQWKFGTNVAQNIIRDPGTPSETNMNYEVTDTGLIITFNIPSGSQGWPGGRIESVSGDWRFEFTKQ